MRNKYIGHFYLRRIGSRSETHSFWGIKAEFLFRGYSKDEMFQMESRILDLIHEEKIKIMNGNKLREITIERLDSIPFKDKVL